MITQYDPTKVIVSFVPLATTGLASITATGFADGEFINVEFSVDKRSKHIGTDGTGRHILSKDKSGMVTLSLSDYSPTNDLLITLDTADVPFGLSVVDKTTTAGVFFADSCTLVKIPNFVRGKEATENQYQFQFLNGTVIHSGAKDI